LGFKFPNQEVCHGGKKSECDHDRSGDAYLWNPFATGVDRCVFTFSQLVAARYPYRCGIAGRFEPERDSPGFGVALSGLWRGFAVDGDGPLSPDIFVADFSDSLDIFRAVSFVVIFEFFPYE